MKRMIAALLVAFGLPILANVPTASAAGPGPGPKCTHILDGSPNYTNQFTGTPTLFVQPVDLAAASCKGTT